MTLQDFFNGATALRLGMWLGRHVPPGVGYTLADALTWGVSRQRNSAHGAGDTCQHTRGVGR